ncbi:MAG TPA: hypothetical protein PKL30_18675 [Leptospiraceae bacterium]|nr:hypothetical protein [Leptospiraceae bacterium]
MDQSSIKIDIFNPLMVIRSKIKKEEEYNKTIARKKDTGKNDEFKDKDMNNNKKDEIKDKDMNNNKKDEIKDKDANNNNKKQDAREKNENVSKMKGSKNV